MYDRVLLQSVTHSALLGATVGEISAVFVCTGEDDMQRVLVLTLEATMVTTVHGAMSYLSFCCTHDLVPMSDDSRRQWTHHIVSLLDRGVVLEGSVRVEGNTGRLCRAVILSSPDEEACVCPLDVMPPNTPVTPTMSSPTQPFSVV